MKSEDFERLKAVCEKEGFKLELSSPWDQTYRISKKDIWDGVEFAQLVNYIQTTSTIKNQFTSGKIYRISRIYVSDYKRLEVKEDDSGRLNGLDLLKFKPSTEQAYIEQLKKEAFERFGEIKEGVSIESVDENIYSEWFIDSNFCYYIESDSLFFQDCLIYRRGKWATRVKERVEVDFVWSEKKLLGKKMPVVAFHDKKKYGSTEAIVESVFKGKDGLEIATAFRFLASQLEKYLNEEL